MDEENHDDYGLLTRQRSPFSARSCRSSAFTPQPSLALVRFWQGRVELSLRIICFVVSIGALASSVLTLLTISSPDSGEEVIDSSRLESHKVTVCVVSTATLSSFVQLLVVVSRFLNFKFASSHSSMIHVLDIIFSVMVTSAYFTLTVPLVVFSRDVAHFQEILPHFDATLHYHAIIIRCYATIALCCCGVAAFLSLSVWMSVYLSFSWDRKMEGHLQQQQAQRAATEEHHEENPTAHAENPIPPS